MEGFRKVNAMHMQGVCKVYARCMEGVRKTHLHLEEGSKGLVCATTRGHHHALALALPYPGTWR